MRAVKHGAGATSLGRQTGLLTLAVVYRQTGLLTLAVVDRQTDRQTGVCR